MNDQINPVPTYDGPLPPATVQLPEGHLACRHCGTSTRLDEDHDREIVEWIAPIRGGHPDAVRDIGARILEREFTRCSECVARHARADELARRLPQLAALVGNKLSEHLALALDVYAALGLPIPKTETMSFPEAAQIVRALPFPGNGIQYAQNGAVGVAAGAPWRHLDQEGRERLRGVLGALLARRVALSAPPVEVPCPDGRGCLFCGVEKLTVPAVKVHDLGGREEARARLWQPLKASADALGGGNQSVWVKGHVCPPCAVAISDAGALGPSALARSYVAHLKETGVDTSALWGWQADEVLFDGLKAWAVTGTETPNPTRWAHAGELIQS